MKKSQLDKLIREEISKALNENIDPIPGDKFKIKGNYYLPTRGEYGFDIGREKYEVEYVKEAPKKTSQFNYQTNKKERVEQNAGYFRRVGKEKLFTIQREEYNDILVPIR